MCRPMPASTPSSEELPVGLHRYVRRGLVHPRLRSARRVQGEGASRCVRQGFRARSHCGADSCTHGVDCTAASRCRIDCAGPGSCIDQPVMCSGSACRSTALDPTPARRASIATPRRAPSAVSATGRAGMTRRPAREARAPYAASEAALAPSVTCDATQLVISAVLRSNVQGRAQLRALGRNSWIDRVHRPGQLQEGFGPQWRRGRRPVRWARRSVRLKDLLRRGKCTATCVDEDITFCCNGGSCNNTMNGAVWSTLAVVRDSRALDVRDGPAGSLPDDPVVVIVARARELFEVRGIGAVAHGDRGVPGEPDARRAADRAALASRSKPASSSAEQITRARLAPSRVGLEACIDGRRPRLSRRTERALNGHTVWQSSQPKRCSPTPSRSGSGIASRCSMVRYATHRRGSSTNGRANASGRTRVEAARARSAALGDRRVGLERERRHDLAEEHERARRPGTMRRPFLPTKPRPARAAHARSSTGSSSQSGRAWTGSASCRACARAARACGASCAARCGSRARARSARSIARAPDPSLPRLGAAGVAAREADDRSARRAGCARRRGAAAPRGRGEPRHVAVHAVARRTPRSARSRHRAARRRARSPTASKPSRRASATMRSFDARCEAIIETATQ